MTPYIDAPGGRIYLGIPSLDEIRDQVHYTIIAKPSDFRGAEVIITNTPKSFKIAAKASIFIVVDKDETKVLKSRYQLVGTEEVE